jgi:hypothetical protein
MSVELDITLGVNYPMGVNYPNLLNGRAPDVRILVETFWI